MGHIRAAANTKAALSTLTQDGAPAQPISANQRCTRNNYSACQICTVSSQLAEAMRFPSDDQATPVTTVSASWPL